jgi:integrase
VRECTRQQAKAFQVEWHAELIETFAAPRAPKARQRLRDFVPSWLAGRKDELKPSSALKIAIVWDLHIVTSTLADLYIDEITWDDVTAWIERLKVATFIPGKGKAENRETRSEKSTARAYSKTTIRGYFRVLRTIITAATAHMGVRNPCSDQKAPRAKRRSKNFLGAADLSNVLGYVRERFPFWYPAVLLDSFTALRWGELSALRWKDIDEQKGVIRVERGNWRGKVINSTKTGDDEDPEEKLVPLMAEIADVLRAHRQRMVKDQHPGLAEGWIFPTERGTLHKGTPLRDVLDAACAACNTERRITPHGLRHTANDLLRRCAAGDVVRAITGHATEAMTHHYSHVDEAEKLEAQRRAFAVVAGTNEKAVAKSENVPKEGPKGGIKGGIEVIDATILVREAAQVC